jgi:hypothetical protein
LASKACGSQAFEETAVQVGESDLTGPFLGLVPYKIATRYGYAICPNAQLSPAELIALRRGDYFE